ncbi:unnamed protein product, partial [Amoebophrya sp. A25]
GPGSSLYYHLSHQHDLPNEKFPTTAQMKKEKTKTRSTEKKPTVEKMLSGSNPWSTSHSAST